VITPPKNELAALGLVNREPMHGYRLNQTIQQMGLEQWANLSQSSIYNALGRLAEQGAVTVSTEREGKAPERTVYHIAAKGREMLADLLRQALSYVGPEDRLFYLAVAFMEVLPEEEIVRILEGRKERLEEYLDKHRCMSEEEGDPLHVRMMTKAGCSHMEVETGFCAELIGLLRERPGYLARFRGEER